MFKSAIVYRIAPTWEKPAIAELEEALQATPFVPCAPTQRESAGWVSPRPEDNSPLVESIGGQFILKLAHQARKLPASAVKEALAERMAQIEQETGRKPRGKAKKALKEEIEFELLPRAFTRTVMTLIWVDPTARLLYVGTGSQKVADRVTTELVQVLDGKLPLALVRTQLSAATAMAHWLREKDAPAGFTVDRECVLQQPDEKASVKYSHHRLDGDDVVKHIEEGKVPTQLAMTWNDRVSFVLTDTFQLKRIHVLDVETAESEGAGDKGVDSGFDADVAIITAELSGLLPDLLEALGGEMQPTFGNDPAANDGQAQAAA